MDLRHSVIGTDTFCLILLQYVQSRIWSEVKVTQSNRDEVTLCLCVCVCRHFSLFLFYTLTLNCMCIISASLLTVKTKQIYIFFILYLANKSFHLDLKEPIKNFNYGLTSNHLDTVAPLGHRWACISYGTLAGIAAPFANLIRIRYQGPCVSCKKGIPLLRSGFISMHVMTADK